MEVVEETRSLLEELEELDEQPGKLAGNDAPMEGRGYEKDGKKPDQFCFHIDERSCTSPGLNLRTDIC